MSQNTASFFSMLSEKGFKLLVFEGYKFSKNRMTQSGQKWRCTDRRCRAHLFTNDDGEVLLKAVGVHNHEPCPNLHRQYISNSVKFKAAEIATEPPAKLMKEEIVSAPEYISREITKDDLDRVRRNISSAKRKKVPPLPKYDASDHEVVNSTPVVTCQDSPEVYKSRWFAYDAMEFLRGRVLPTNKTDALDGVNEENQTQPGGIEEELQNKMLYESSIMNDNSIAASEPPKRTKKKKIGGIADMRANAFELLQTATELITSPQEDDEVTAFFKYVTTKVKSFPPQKRRDVQKAVFDILMKVDLEINEIGRESEESTHYAAPSPSQMVHVSMSSDGGRCFT